MSSFENKGTTLIIDDRTKSVLEIIFKTCHIIDVGWFDTQYFFLEATMALYENNYFTELEWFAIDDALDALLIDLSESAEPEFSVSLEKAVLAYDLDQCQTEELIRQYDFLQETLTHYPTR